MELFVRTAVATLLLAMSAVAPLGARDLAPGEIFRASRAAIVEVRKVDAAGGNFRGTGFFVAPKLIATNHHAVSGAREVILRGAEGGTEYTFVRIVASNATADIALVEVAEPAPRHLRLDAATRVNVGDPVYVIGNIQGYASSLSQGIVSGIRANGPVPMFQITATVSEGSSGSPLLNAQGDVVGIVFGRLRQEAQIGFATPAAHLAALGVGRRPLAEAEQGRWGSGEAAAPERTTPERTTLSPAAPARPPLVSKVRIGVPEAESAVASAHALKALIEALLPVSVELVASTHAEILEGVGAPDGAFDIHPEVWLPNHRHLLGDGVRLNSRPYDAVQGVCVPRHVAQRFGVSRLSDLADARVARLFDLDEDGKGDLWIGPKGWLSAEITRLKARDYGFAETFTLSYGPEAKFFEMLARAMPARWPIAFHCYGPHWMFRKYELVKLAEPAYAPGCFQLAADRGSADWFRRSRAACGDPRTTVHVAYSARLAWQQPQLAALLAHVAFGYEEMNRLIFAMTGGDARKSTVARDWARKAAAKYRPLDRLVSDDLIDGAPAGSPAAPSPGR